MWSCDQSLVTIAFLWEKLSQPHFYEDLTRKTIDFVRYSWLKFINLGLALGMVLNFYTSVVNRSRLTVKKSWGVISNFVEVTRKKLVWVSFYTLPLSRKGLIILEYDLTDMTAGVNINKSRGSWESIICHCW